MKSELKSNYEKVLLAFLLLALAVTSVISIILVRYLPDIKLVDGGALVENDDEKLEFASANLLNLGKIKTLENFVYCRNSSCKYLIHKSLAKCNWCGTSLEGTVKKTIEDSNNNKVPDKLEIEWGLTLDDPKALFKDQDQDGFNNIDEYDRDCSPIDSSLHPPLALRASFKGLQNKFVPFTVKDIVFIKDVRGNEKVYVDGKHWTRGSFYLTVGEDTDWLKVLGVEEVNGKKYAVLQYYSYKFKMSVGEKLQYEGWPKYKVKNEITGKLQLVSLKDKITLKAKSGSNENYILQSYDEAKETIRVFSGDRQLHYELGAEAALAEPVN